MRICPAKHWSPESPQSAVLGQSQNSPTTLGEQYPPKPQSESIEQLLAD
jgi:hypothetical protein